MKDFTLKIYRKFLEKLISQSYCFQTYYDFILNPKDKAVILRHDIDLKKHSSLIFAKLENEYNIKGTYYFRAVKKIFNKYLILNIAKLNHEIGYHYENLSWCYGDYDKAIKDFEKNLNKFREFYPIKTICMHGNTRSKYDNRQLWKFTDYKKKYELIGEPYFDIDFNKVLYLTDTAQRWNGYNIAIRDKVESTFKYNFTTTFDIIDNIEKLPSKIMFTIHPDRWTDNLLEWHRINNIVKIKIFVKNHILKKRAMVLNK